MAAVASGTVVSTWWWLMGLGYEEAGSLADLLGFEATLTLLGEVGIWQLNPATPGFVAAMVFGVTVSLLTAPPDRDVVELFDRVNGPDWVEPASR